MGAQNVKTVYLRWSGLDHRPFRLLVHMALVSLDTPRPNQPARIYWAGRDELARAIGYEPSPTAYRRVREDLERLQRAGAVEVVTAGRAGTRTAYRVRLGGPLQAPSGGPLQAPSGGPLQAPSGGPLQAPQGTTEEPLEEQQQEKTRVLTFNTKRHLRNAGDRDGLGLIDHANA